MTELVPDRPRRVRDSRAVAVAAETPVSVVMAAMGHHVLGEATLPHTGRMGRTDAMGALLRAVHNHTAVADRQRRHMADACAERWPIGPAAMSQMLMTEAESYFFLRLKNAGYGPTTTWDQLVGILKPIVREATQALTPHLTEDAILDPVNAAYTVRLTKGADAFLKACQPVTRFLRDELDEGAQAQDADAPSA